MSPRAVTFALLACAAAACDRPVTGEPSSRPTVAPPEKPFVVFLRDTLVIDRLETPVDAPVTVGSSPSPVTLESDAIDVVSIDDAGALVAHRNGAALVRARGTGSVLSVRVASSSGPLRALPPAVRVRAGEQANIEVVDERGSALPPEAIRWASSAPEVATVSNGLVRGGAGAGAATLVGSYGSERVTVRIEVDPRPPGGPLSIRPRAPSLRRGELVAFEATTASGPLDAEWTSSNPRVAARLGGGAFRAVGRGEATVCAVASSRRACTKVEVEP